MWKLKHTKKDHIEHYIFVGEDYVVGRKDSSLLITNDPSVSRKHAVLYVKHPQENLGNPSRKSSLFLRDEKSKYGTFKNGVRISSDEELSDNDVIKFGQFESEFRVHRIPLVVTTSCLDVPAKMKLRQIVYKLGGHVVSEWLPSCSYLAMSLIKVTVKALCCLVSLKPIVSPHYFQELEENLRGSASLIPVSQFIPPIGEALIDKDAVSFDVNSQRKSIFKNKTFFFMDEKQFKKLHLGIALGGGNASILSEGDNDLSLLLREGSCFIEPVKDQVVKPEDKIFLKQIISTLQKKNLRMIPESDIGLAVAYVSTEKYCNPEFSIGAAIFGSQKMVSQTLSEREVYVPDTQEQLERPVHIDDDRKSKRPRLEAPDTTNLTSSTERKLKEEKLNLGEEEAMDVSEVPLSAQIKQELDDIFEEDLEEIEPSKDVLPSLKKQNEPTAKIKESGLKKEPISFISKKLVDSPEKSPLKNIVQEKSSPLKEKSSFISESQLLPKVLEKDDFEELPQNVVNVKIVPLMFKKKESSVLQQNKYSHVKNFKKFKKVRFTKAQMLPRIIGIHELVPYDKDAVKLVNDHWDDPLEVKNDEPIRGEFDWETPNE